MHVILKSTILIASNAPFKLTEFIPLIAHEDASGRLVAAAAPPSVACHCATNSTYVRLVQT